jgi:2',3'-cyclic-nucleotide 2'-phosphodiesterase (5'-nucleotidase family)
LNDLHAHLVPHTDIEASPPGGGSAAKAKVVIRGGIARLKTVVDELRAQTPDASVLVNVGDTFHGGVEALYTQGEAIAKPVAALGIDVGTPGNWDYAYGPNISRLRYLGDAKKGMQECIQMGIAAKSAPDGSVPLPGPPAPGPVRDGGSPFGDAGGPFADGGSPFGDAGGPFGGDSGTPMTSAVTQVAFPNLAANVTFKASLNTTEGEPFLPGTMTKVVNGVKVGFIGISSDIVPRMHPMLACGLQFLGADDLESGDAGGWASKYTTLVESNAKALRANGAQIVVVLSELSVQKDQFLADRIGSGSVDVFFSGHTHEATFEARSSVSGALVVESGDDGYLGRMDLGVENGKVVDHAWQLIPITAAVPENATMKALVDEARAPFLVPDPNMTIPGNTGAQQALHESIATVVGRVAHPLDRKDALESSFNDFFSEALRLRAGTTAAMAPGFRYDSPIATAESLVEDNVVVNGEVTLEDTYRFFPVVYGMGKATTTGAHLKSVLEATLTEVFSTNIPLQNGGWVNGFAGFRAQIDLSQPDGHRVVTLTRPDGATISDGEQVAIAGCRRPMDAEGILCSHSGFSSVTDLMKDDGTVWTNVDILRDGFQRGNSLSATKVFQDVSGISRYPVDAFVQPLRGAKK